MLLEQGDIEVCVEGSFNNNINQILPNFNPLPPLEWTNMDILKTIYPLSHDPLGISTGPLHVVIECPLKLVVESS